MFTLQTLPGEPDGARREVAESSGFSLHAGIVAKASQRDKLEHLARYVARPPVASRHRAAVADRGRVRGLRTEDAVSGWNDARHIRVIFEPEDFIARLAALVPKPRAHLTRLCGDLHRRVYANSKTMRSSIGCPVVGARNVETELRIV